MARKGEMRNVWICLACILAQGVLLLGARAADLMQQVPASSPVYAQLRLLNQHDLLTPTEESTLSGVAPRLLTRYDVAFLLVEPLERLTVLVVAQDNPKLTPEQRRRCDLAYHALFPLPASELDRIVTAANQLRLSFSDAIETLAPGLDQRAATALQKLRQPAYRPWIKQSSADAGDWTPTWHLTVDPKAMLDPIGNPLPVPPSHSESHPETLFMRSGNAHPTEGLIDQRPASMVEAAADFAIGRFRLYGTVSTLPGQDQSILTRPDGSGRAMLGLQLNLLQLSDIGISGIFEYHVMRSGDPGNMNTDAGAVGGIGLSW